jgi:hypothetical protein
MGKGYLEFIRGWRSVQRALPREKPGLEFRRVGLRIFAARQASEIGWVRSCGRSDGAETRGFDIGAAQAVVGRLTRLVYFSLSPLDLPSLRAWVSGRLR